MPDNQTSELAQAIQEATDKASLLVREEIELAKAEMTEKVTKLVRGAVVGIVAGIFAVFGLIYLLDAAAWGIWQASGTDTSFWIGFLVVAVVLFLLGALAALFADRGRWDERRDVARRFVERDRNWSSNISRYAPVYQKLADGRTKPR